MSTAEARSPSHQAYLDAQQNRLAAIRKEFDTAFPHAGPVVLEIGCGHGHYLTAYAQQHPEARCIGIDLVTKRILLSRRKRDKRQVANLHFLKAEVREFLSVWPARLQLERVFILFPDPWPKKRHIKNRIIQTGLLDRLAEIGRPGTALHFRTDHPGNFAWCTEVLAGHPGWEIAPDSEWPFENPSYFQDLFEAHQSLTAVCR